MASSRVLLHALKLTDQDRRTNDGSDTTAKTAVEHHGQGLVDNDIAQQQGDQDPMFSLLEKLENPLGVLLLGIGGVLGDDLEVDAVLAHQGDGQAGKGTAEEHEEDGCDEEDPELGASLLLVAIVEVAQDVERGGGGADGEESFGEGEDGGPEGHQPVMASVLWAHGCRGQVVAWAACHRTILGVDSSVFLQDARTEACVSKLLVFLSRPHTDWTQNKQCSEKLTPWSCLLHDWRGKTFVGNSPTVNCRLTGPVREGEGKED